MAEYDVAYDILDEGIRLRSLLFLAAWLAGLAVGVFCFTRYTPPDGPKRVCFAFALVFWFLVGGCGTGNELYQRVRCLDWARSGDYQIAEGEVRDFKPMPSQGHAREEFSVSGTHFT